MTGGLPEELATETGLSASFAPRGTRVIPVSGEGDEAGTRWQRSLRITQDKEPLAFGSLLLCSPCPAVCTALCTCALCCRRGKGEDGKGITFIKETPLPLAGHFQHGSCFWGRSCVPRPGPGTSLRLCRSRYNQAESGRVLDISVLGMRKLKPKVICSK